jgi:hypothetical protein
MMPAWSKSTSSSVCASKPYVCDSLSVIDLVRQVPEALEPRCIEIADGSEATMPAQDTKQVEHEPAKASQAA